MRFGLVLPSPAPVCWHRAVAEGIAALPGVSVSATIAAAEPLPATVQLLLRLERLVRRIGPDHPLDPTSLAAPPAGDAADPVIDLTGAPPQSGARGRLVLTCGGTRVELGAIAAIFAGTIPVLALDWHGPDGVRPIARWATAVENRAVLAAGLADVLGRAAQLVVTAARRIADGEPPERLALGFADPVPAAPPGSIGRFVGASVSTTARHRLERLVGTAPRWAVGVREAGPRDRLPDLARGPFRPIPDGGTAFLADPFPAGRDGRRAIFVEEFPFATEKGVISVVDVAEDGSLSPPRVILDEACHLSYPYLVEDDGVLYMIPETSGRRTVELWRCTAFPDRFEPVAALIEGVDLSDATVIRDGGGWLMFAASRARWCSSWDALDLWRAPALTGPWTRVGDAPVLVDPRVARPAGTPFRMGDRLVRPVQDCSHTYGGALAFAAVDRIGPDFAQTVLARVRPRDFAGMHSFARGAGLEVIDVNGPVQHGPFVPAREGH